MLISKVMTLSQERVMLNSERETMEHDDGGKKYLHQVGF